MRKLILFFALGALLTSCKDSLVYPGYEDDTSTSTGTGTGTGTTTSSNNYFQIDGGSKITINQAAIIGFKAVNSTDENYYQVSFISTDGTNTKTTQLALFFPFGKTIDGTYGISSTTYTLDPDLTMYTEANGTSINSFSNLTQGSCTITRSGSNINVKFTIKPSSGKVIAGQFTGAASIVEH